MPLGCLKLSMPACHLLRTVVSGLNSMNLILTLEWDGWDPRAMKIAAFVVNQNEKQTAQRTSQLQLQWLIIPQGNALGAQLRHACMHTYRAAERVVGDLRFYAAPRGVRFPHILTQEPSIALMAQTRQPVATFLFSHDGFCRFFGLQEIK